MGDLRYVGPTECWAKGAVIDCRRERGREGREEEEREGGKEEGRRAASPSFKVDYDGDPGFLFINSQILIEIVHEPKSE